MATRWRMDDVQQRTSKEIQTSQSFRPRNHLPLISLTAAIGMTRAATIRSATASDATRKLATLRRLRSSKMAAMTKMLPTTVAMVMTPSTIEVSRMMYRRMVLQVSYKQIFQLLKIREPSLKFFQDS